MEPGIQKMEEFRAETSNQGGCVGNQEKDTDKYFISEGQAG